MERRVTSALIRDSVEPVNSGCLDCSTSKSKRKALGREVDTGRLNLLSACEQYSQFVSACDTDREAILQSVSSNPEAIESLSWSVTCIIKKKIGLTRSPLEQLGYKPTREITVSGLANGMRLKKDQPTPPHPELG